MNSKGQFSIIAALLVAVVLIAAVMTTYSAIRYSPVQEQPQILSAIDETNLGIKEILCFTVGYYGAVLKVTGNMTYAQQLAQSYLKSGLDNLGQIRPEWGASFTLNNLSVNAKWFSDQSYSQGNLTVTYNLDGLGISGISYTTSSRLDVETASEGSPNQAQLTITRDDGEPLINLGRSNLKFYSYNYANLTWQLSSPVNIASYADGTYVLDLPVGVAASGYVIQVEDTRGLMVLASSFTQLTSTVAWNSTGFRQGFRDFVDTATLVVGTQSSFAAQQEGPDGVYDTLTETRSGTFTIDNYPSNWNPLGSTSAVSGALTDLQSDNGGYVQLQSYPTEFSSSYNTIGFDSQNSAILSVQDNSLSWLHTTGLGNDRILLVAVDVFRSNSVPTTVTSVTYDGMPLTQLATAYYSSNPRVRSYVFYLFNPFSGTKTINVNFAGDTVAIGGSITYTNVNQTVTPTSNTATGSGASQSVSLTASGNNSKVLFGHLGVYRTNTYSVTDPQYTRWSQISQQYKSFGSEKNVTRDSVSTSWTTSSTASWVAIGVLLQPTQVGTAFTFGAEFTGSSNTDYWNNITWTIDASSTTSGLGVTYQLYNYRTEDYVTVGDVYLTDILGTSNTTKTQTITFSLIDFRDSAGNWKMKISTQTTTERFDVKLDLIRYSVNEDNYALNLQLQWLTVNASNVRQDLCIKTGDMDTEPLVVQVLHNGSWHNLMTLAPNYFNNVSLAPYIDSSILTIRFVSSSDSTDPSPDTWNIDSVNIKDQPDINFLINLQQSTFTLEVLQNGTMRWLGQNMQVTTQTLPIPPISVKAIHVNQTINGLNQEVPFQIEDWASNYQIPLGLTSNTTVFSNRQMIVFLLNSSVTDFTIWWDGSDTATQTPMAFTNRYFTNDNTATSTLTNGKLTLYFSGGTVKSTVDGTTTYSTATFMRINAEASSYGAGCAYVIHHGIVRDIVQQESEWSTGPNGAPNVYANIIITLPAQANFYTYQLRFMFVTSSQSRTITDLCPIQLAPSATIVQTQTENGALAGFPLIQDGTGMFSNYATGGWTPHHFSQFLLDDAKGAGLIFTDTNNQKLYVFDSFPSSTSEGALYAGSSGLKLLPVSSGQVVFQYAYDITWQGAVATFDNTTPVCSLYDGTTPMGLWILAEYPPTLTVTPKN